MSKKENPTPEKGIRNKEKEEEDFNKDQVGSSSSNQREVISFVNFRYE
jgi:hypothetical protein